MLPLELEDFTKLMRDLCIAFNRPFVPPQCSDLVRVYWEALRRFPLPEIRSRANTAMLSGKKFPAPADLKPLEDAPKPANTYEPPAREFHHFERIGNFSLFKLLAKRTPISEKLVVDEITQQVLVREKDKIVSDLIAMSQEETVEPSQVLEALDRAFTRILTHKAAA